MSHGEKFRRAFSARGGVFKHKFALERLDQTEETLNTQMEY